MLLIQSDSLTEESKSEKKGGGRDWIWSDSVRLQGRNITSLGLRILKNQYSWCSLNYSLILVTNSPSIYLSSLCVPGTDW